MSSPEAPRPKNETPKAAEAEKIAEKFATVDHLTMELGMEFIKLLDLLNAADTPLSVHEKLASNPSKYVRGAVAESVRTPPNVLRSLLSSGDEYVVDRVLSNEKLPQDVLSDLIADPKVSSGALLFIAQNPSLSESLIQELLRSGSYNVRQVLVRKNPATSIKILREIYAKDRDAETMQHAFIERKNTPTDIVDYCVIHATNPLYRLEGIDHPNISKIALQYLADRDMDPIVRSEAKKRLRNKH